MFETLHPLERHLVYETLLHAIKTNSGLGCANADQGHPAYRSGRDGNSDYQTFGDSPERNTLFKMMHELSILMNEQDESFRGTPDYVFSWADFCRLVTNAYDQRK
jgi:hypothetical protein